MGDENKENEEIIVKNTNNEKQIYANTFRIGFSGTEILIDFGRAAPSETSGEKVEVNVVSKIAIPPEILVDIIAALFKAGIDYENKYNKDIGGFAKALPKDKSKDND